MEAYAPYPKQVQSYDITFLQEKLEKDDYRIIYAGDTFKNVPLTLWFMRRVKSAMAQASVRADYSRMKLGPVEYCLEVSEGVVENSFTMPSKSEKNKSVLFVGHSWLSQAVQLTYDFIKNQFGCTAPLVAFVLPLDPSKYTRSGRKNKPALTIRFMDEHLEHLLVQERFLGLLTRYQAAKEAREMSAGPNRTNPQRLLDLEKEKMHISNFREAAANLGGILWKKPYMTRRVRAHAGWHRGAVGMVDAHGQPTTKELKAWKKRRRLEGKVGSKSDTAGRAQEERLGSREDQFTVEPDISEEVFDVINELDAEEERQMVDALQEQALNKYKKSERYKNLVEETQNSSMDPYSKAKTIQEAENKFVIDNLRKRRRISSAKVTDVRNFLRQVREGLGRKKWSAEDITKFTQGSAKELGGIRQKMLRKNYRPSEIIAYMLAKMEAKRAGKNLTLKKYEKAKRGQLRGSESSSGSSSESSSGSSSGSGTDSEDSDSGGEINSSLSSPPGSVLLSPRSSRNRVTVGMIGAL